ncbi:hypothetical protein SAY86_001145 [Trapa natans]|uniref:Uncharacterized protein n=1 Tax=Trapa natans TaxID=22666 RepID=A0AAN7MQI4_TRANT|nr:hypothetical protein SAY86_001145 [Trapa natans]
MECGRETEDRRDGTAMESQENGDLDRTNTGTGNEAIVAARKKRLRRVSFADVEITSVHIFKRDEDYSDSTPPSDPKTDEDDGKLSGDDGLVLFGDLGDHNDDFKELSCDREDEKEDDCGEEGVGRASFFRPIESPSPGSSTVGSAVSNDEDNFFGPVQPGFIRPGRFSDSGLSDENNDITMDSTAFSMHYHSLARSETGELKTPSRMGHGSTENFLNQDVTDGNQGSLMAMTNAGKLILESSLLLDDSKSAGKDSNEMSLVGDDTHKYDYGRLSPTLDALLAEGNKDLHAYVDVQEANAMSIQHVMRDVSNRHDCPAYTSDSSHTPQRPINGNKAMKIKFEVDEMNIGFSSITKVSQHSDGGKFVESDVTALQGRTYHSSTEENLKENYSRNNGNNAANSDKMVESPFAGSISSISAKRREIFSLAHASPANFLNLTPLPAQSARSSSKGSATLGLDLSSIGKSISKYRSVDTDPAMPAIKNGIETLKLKISNYLSANSPRYTSHTGSSIDASSKGIHAPVAHLESINDDPMIVDLKRKPIVDSSEIPSPHNMENVHRKNQFTLAMESGEPHDDLCASTPLGNKPATDVRALTLRSNEFSLLGLGSSNFRESALRASEVGSPLMNLALHQRKDYGDACTTEFLTSPMQEANQNTPLGDYCQKDVSAVLNQQNHLNEFVGANSEENRTQNPLKKPAEIPVRVKSNQSPCQTGLSNFLTADFVELPPRGMIPSTPSKVNCIENNPYQIEGRSPADDCLESISRKRKNEVVPGDECCRVSRTKRSFEAMKNHSYDFSGHLEPPCETKEHAPDVPLLDWKDVLMKFSQDSEAVLSPLHDQLDLRGIDILEEILDYLQKVRSYDTLSSEMQSKLNNATHKRSAEIMLLLHKLLYEKARFKLILERQNRLKKIAQNLSSGIEESQKLKHIFKERVPLSVETGNQLDDCHHCTVNSKLKNPANDNVIPMRKELEVLNQGVRSLSDSLFAYCKIKEEPSCTSDIALLDKSLKKKIYSTLVRRQLQPWKIADYESTNNHHNLSLDYLGFIRQSISVAIKPMFGLNVSNKLQDVNIDKTFPNMGACTAFAYVFNGEANEKMVSCRSLAQKTQVTNSLLRNLLEVAEEVHRARVEIKNLISATFHPPNERQLDLLVSFVDLHSNQRVRITLDMTCLNRGIYPSEVLPDLVKFETNGMPQSIATEIRDAASGLAGGQQRIVRLCRCISSLVQCSSNRT